MYVTFKEMEKILVKTPREPADTDDWIREQCVVQSFLIYNRRTGRTVCTRCGHVDGDGKEYTGMHGAKRNCPICGEEVIILSEGIGRKVRAEWFRLLTWARKGKTVCGRLWEIEASFEEAGPPQLKKWLSALYIVNAKEQHYYKHKSFSWSPDQEWEEYKTFKIPPPPGGMGYGWSTKYDTTYMRIHGLEEVFTKSDLKYLWIPGWCTSLPPEEMIAYIGCGMRQQSIELMIKAGFTNLVLEKLHGRRNGLIINWQGKSLERILKQTKRHVRKLQLMNAATNEVRVFRELAEEEQEVVSGRVLRDIADYVRAGEADILRKRIGKITSFTKWMRYMDGQITRETGTREYIDYIDMCKKNGADIHRKSIIFPEDLKEAHDRAIIEYAAKQDRGKTEAIREKARIETYETDLLTILPADTQEKLNIESAYLHHCVRTYGDRIAGGKCWIWFVRRKDDRERPYYTMETDTDGNMVQCRGLRNCRMTNEVEEFVRGFERHLQTEIRKERESV